MEKATLTLPSQNHFSFKLLRELKKHWQFRNQPPGFTPLASWRLLFMRVMRPVSTSLAVTHSISISLAGMQEEMRLIRLRFEGGMTPFIEEGSIWVEDIPLILLVRSTLGLWFVLW